MAFTIKKKPFYSCLLDENHQPVAKVYKKNLWSDEKNIVCSNNHTRYTSSIVLNKPTNKSWNYADSTQYVLYQDKKPIVTAHLTYAKNPKRTTTQKLTQQPPQVDDMTLETPYGTWDIHRNKDNSVSISQNHLELGTVSSFFTLKNMHISFKDNYDPCFLAGIYTLIEYMMQEENLLCP